MKIIKNENYYCNGLVNDRNAYEIRFVRKKGVHIQRNTSNILKYHRNISRRRSFSGTK